MKKIFCFLFLILLVTVFDSFAAKPFVAPVDFDLDGSTIDLTLSFTRLNRTYNASLNPNPAPVTGKIEIQDLNQDSGVFNGKFKDITATTTVSNVPGIPKIQLGVEINGSTTGIFIWNTNKVIFNPVYMTARININGQIFEVLMANIPIKATYNDGHITLDFDISKQGSYNNFEFDLTAKVHLTGEMQKPNNTNDYLWVNLSTNDTVYSENENFKLFVSLGNSGKTKNADLYIILEHNGHYYSFPEYAEGFKPVLRNYNFKSGLYALNILIHNVLLPSATTPPIFSAGNYSYYAVFTEPNTSVIIGKVESTGFSYNLNGSINGQYDGIWEGTAVSNVHTAFCDGTSNVKFKIINNRIDGSASEIIDDGDEYGVTGYLNSQGKVEDGVIWDDIAPVGGFDGSVEGRHMNGSWSDIYGCYGTFSLTKK